MGIAFFMLLQAARAQSGDGSITGAIKDASSVPVEGASVEAHSAEVPGAYRAVSRKDGTFVLTGMPPGTYDLQATSTSLQPVDRKGLKVEAGKQIRLDLVMEFNTQLGTLGEDRVSQTADMHRHHPPSGPTPRTADGKPDLSGVYWTPRTVDPGKPELLPWAAKVTAERLADNRKDSPQGLCLPNAVLRLGPLFELVQSKAFLVIIADDDYPGFHQVYLDGRKHPEDPYSWYGHNTGAWQGDTLVVDRVGFNDRVWLDQDLHPHTDKLHVVERYRRPDLGHLEIETTVDDPGTFLHPYTTKRIADLAPDQEIHEFICNENNQDPAHLVGK